jgi:hypothetical protein
MQVVLRPIGGVTLEALSAKSDRQHGMRESHGRRRFGRTRVFKVASETFDASSRERFVDDARPR